MGEGQGQYRAAFCENQKCELNSVTHFQRIEYLLFKFTFKKSKKQWQDQLIKGNVTSDKPC